MRYVRNATNRWLQMEPCFGAVARHNWLVKGVSQEVLLQMLDRNPALKARNAHLDHQTSAPQLERSASNEPVGPAQAKKTNPGIRSVRITSRRVRLLDIDNLCGKYHLDALRYEGLLAGDSPKHITLEVTQEKVSKGQECTVIEVTQAASSP